MALSVISRRIDAPSTCADFRARSSSSTSVGSKVWRSETLMLAVSGALAMVCQRRSCAQTRLSTHTPIGTISPFSSAMEMKSFGAMVPRSG